MPNRKRLIHPPSLLTGLSAALTAVSLFVAVPGASAVEPPETLWEACATGTGSDQCLDPIGIDTDASTGEIYVIDSDNARIKVFSPWGEFLRAWGWGVADGGNELQACGSDASPPTTACLSGKRGVGTGQFASASGGDGSAAGIAVDSSGDVYVSDFRACIEGLNCSPGDRANRVQKFAPDGSFILMFGREVNLTKVEERKAQEAASEPVTITAAEENLCTKASGDTCGRGTEGEEPGAFGAGPLKSFEPRSDLVAIGPDDVVYVGGQERIQEFTPSGAFVKAVAVPGEQLFTLDLDSLGNIFAGFAEPGSLRDGAKGEVRKLSPTGAPLCTAALPRAVAAEEGLAIAATVDGGFAAAFGDNRNGPSSKVLRFNSTCVAEPATEFLVAGLTAFQKVKGLATSTACGLNDKSLYAITESSSAPLVRAYYPQPDPTLCPPPLQAPTITTQYAVSVEPTRATVLAQINPHFWPDTTYYLEWGEEDCREHPAGCEERVLLPGASLEGEVNVPVATAPVEIEGLKPDTTYHFRFVAQSGGGGPVNGGSAEEGASFTTPSPALPPDSACPNHEARSQQQAFLPDCRAFEMVTPVHKEGGDVLANVEMVGDSAAFDRVDTSGNRFTYSSARAFADPLAAPYTSQYLSTRGSQGWVSTSISPAQEGRPLVISHGFVEPTPFRAFDENLCSGWVLSYYAPKLDEAALPGYANLYRRALCGQDFGPYEALTRVEPLFESSPGTLAPMPPNRFAPQIQGISADGSHALFMASGALGDQGRPCADPVNCGNQLYDYTGGVAHEVCVLPNDTLAADCTLGAGAFEGGEFGRSFNVHRAVSVDGSRVFWTADSEGTGPLYARLDGATTVTVSSADAEFWTAAADGSRVIYTVGPIGTEGALWEFDMDSLAKTRLAKVSTGVMGASVDATRVYFTSPELLPGTEPNSEGDEAELGADNLYLYDSESQSYTYVATLAPNDVEANADPPFPAPVSRAPSRRTSRVASDGQFAAFPSTASLTGYDNRDAASGEPDAEVYLYDAAADRLRCVSCDETGARPSGRELAIGINSYPRWVASSIPVWQSQTYPQRALSDSGDHLFFESTSALVPADDNDAQDVYEWRMGESREACEAVGAEDFREQEGGCLSLISRGDQDSEFLDASSDGKDVFIRTSVSLVPEDPDNLDIYDARRDGGFSVIPGPPMACEGEACQQSIQAPTRRSLGSSVTRIGNPARKARCPKGRHREKAKGGKVRCVKPRKGPKRISRGKGRESR